MVVNAGHGNGVLGPTVMGNISGRSAAVDTAKKAVVAQSNFIKSHGKQLFEYLDPQQRLFLELKYGRQSAAINALV